MTDNKKKPVRKEKVDNIEESLKPVKKLKDPKEKPVKLVIDEEILPEDEADMASLPEVESETNNDVVNETEETSEERPSEFKKIRNVLPDDELEIAAVKAVKHTPSAEDFDWEAFENEELKRYFLKSDKIIYITSINNASDLIRYAEFVVAPSRIEPLSYVMLESGLFAKPFIGGNTGGIREFIEHKVSGYLVKPGDVDSLSEAIVWMLENSDKANEMGKSLNEKVMKLNGKNEYCEKLKEIYYE